MRKVLKEPLLHFLLSGGLLFAVYAWLNRGAEDESRTVRVTAAEVNWLRQTWVRQWSREPDRRELRGVVANHLKEQLLAHEAREFGLAEGDTVVRRRLAQKMEFLVRDAASFADPDEPKLRQLYQDNPEQFQSPARISFTQVFFNREADAVQGLADSELRDPEQLGDRSLLARDYTLADQQAVSNVFGPGFAASVFGLEAGSWQGPVASGYGFHLVRIRDSQAARVPPFEEVREAVLGEWHRQQQARAEKEYLASLLQKYEIVIDDGVNSLLGPLADAIQ